MILHQSFAFFTFSSQTSVVNELKNWCWSKIHNIELRLSGDSPTAKRDSPPFPEDIPEAGSEGPALPALEPAASSGAAGEAAGEVTQAEAAAGNHDFVLQTNRQALQAPLHTYKDPPFRVSPHPRMAVI